MASLVVHQLDGTGGVPPALKKRLEAWAKAGLEPRLFAWSGPAASAELTALLSAEVFERIVFFGLTDLQSIALERALRNASTPCAVLVERPVPGRLDQRFQVISDRNDELGQIRHAGARLSGPRPSALPALSIIVPAWNAERWLERCLGSLVRGGDGQDLEIIVVDDGSTDGTREAALDCARRFAGVSVITQPNRGHGGAINTGLARARGRYVRVVDADDRVDPQALREQLSTLAGESADLVLTDYVEDREGEPALARVPILDRLASGAAIEFEDLVDPFKGVTSWAVLLATSTFRTDVLRRAGVRLTEKSPYVDLEYAVLGLDQVQTVRYRRLPLYLYTLGRPDQTVSAASYRRHYRAHEAVLTRLCEFVTQRPGWSPQRRLYVVERVLNPIVAKHLEVLERLLGDQAEATAFRERMARFPFLRPPTPRSPTSGVRAAMVRLAPAWLRRVPRNQRMVTETVERLLSHRPRTGSTVGWSWPAPTA